MGDDQTENKQACWIQYDAKGTADPTMVALMTPNVDTGHNPVLACVAIGPGEGDLLGEPTVRLGEPLVRLTDLKPRLQSQWHSLLTFARDPKALHDVLKLQWGLWEKHGLGISHASGWRDGIASNTGFPGTHGMLRSANGPQEAQMRGMLHRHTILFPLQRMSMRQLESRLSVPGKGHQRCAKDRGLWFQAPNRVKASGRWG